MRLKSLFNKTCERIDRKILYPFLAKKRAKGLKCTDFTIISNNCWAGKCYEFFGLPKLSPTVGGYFFASDYVKFCENLKYYMSLDLEIIPTNESKYYDTLLSLGQENVFVGILEDVEIIFLHYHNKDVLLEKWKRRVSRINWDKLILKFSYQNECDDDLIRRFLKIEEFPKFCLVGESITNHRDEIVFCRNKGKETIEETENFNWYIDPVKIINERL
ncbi:MAG: DUF1919 domain-containing protein [Clostridia bacterium]|nr:DUF1919 domain-containing protein [Clostridia bacterium]